jgi:hypothetical protein
LEGKIEILEDEKTDMENMVDAKILEIEEIGDIQTHTISELRSEIESLKQANTSLEIKVEEGEEAMTVGKEATEQCQILIQEIEEKDADLESE